ncbi:hypothetical protein LCGC14_1015980 [marine sediment metagenome]|uniref:C2H2-type domain-containing protein n=1 Tax=marine sediment metagenome TaxID=412755 RepID=A0A0F9N3C8_9ZZZZ
MNKTKLREGNELTDYDLRLDGWFYCKLCPKRFSTHEGIERHIAKHHAEKVWH